MSDSRLLPRGNVSWRGAVKIAPGKIVPAKITNFAEGGVQMVSSVMLKEKQIYQIMMEIPDKKDASHRTQVVCKATCIYTILSGSDYRSGMRYFEVPPEHMVLLNDWQN